MGDLSKNFSSHEFECKCGCGFDDVDSELVLVLQRLRNWWRRPVKINSACRCEAHNAEVGGSKNSQHLLGKAADITIQGISPSEVHRYLCEIYPDKFGIGKYSSFTHIDVRESKARWTS